MIGDHAEEKEKATYREFISWAFQGMIIAIAAWVASQIAEMNHSIQDLNVKVAVVITQRASDAQTLQEMKVEAGSMRVRLDRLEVSGRR